MAKYNVIYSPEADRELRKLDHYAKTMIIAWIEKNLVDTDNPRRTGKALKGEFSKLWRYRVGDYRIITRILDSKVEILVVKVGHRKNVYS